jgi:hypothetical protein
MAGRHASVGFGDAGAGAGGSQTVAGRCGAARLHLPLLCGGMRALFLNGRRLVWRVLALLLRTCSRAWSPLPSAPRRGPRPPPRAPWRPRPARQSPRLAACRNPPRARRARPGWCHINHNIAALPTPSQAAFGDMAGRTWHGPLADLSGRLNSHGLDIAHAFPVQLYNASSTAPPLPTFERPCTLAVLIGNSRHLWAPFVRHLRAERRLPPGGPGPEPGGGDGQEASNPLDAYTTQAIEACVREALPAGVRMQVGVGARPGQRAVVHAWCTPGAKPGARRHMPAGCRRRAGCQYAANPLPPAWPAACALRRFGTRMSWTRRGKERWAGRAVMGWAGWALQPARCATLLAAAASGSGRPGPPSGRGHSRGVPARPPARAAHGFARSPRAPPAAAAASWTCSAPAAPLGWPTSTRRPTCACTPPLARGLRCARCWWRTCRGRTRRSPRPCPVPSRRSSSSRLSCGWRS